MAEQTAFKIESSDLAISETLNDFYPAPDFQRDCVRGCRYVESPPEAVAGLIRSGHRASETLTERQRPLTALARKVWGTPTAGKEVEA